GLDGARAPGGICRCDEIEWNWGFDSIPVEQPSRTLDILGAHLALVPAFGRRGRSRSRVRRTGRSGGRRTAPPAHEEPDGDADRQQRERLEPKQPGVPLHLRSVQVEISAALDEVSLDLVVAA